MIAVTVMFGTAWAATQQIEYNDTLDLTAVKDGDEYVPSKNGTNTVTLTGRLGEGVTSCDKNNFTIYGTSGDFEESAVLNLNMADSAQIFTSANVRFFAGGKNNDIKGDTTLNFNSNKNAILWTTRSDQKTIILSGGSNGGSISGNTKAVFNGSLGYDETVSPDKDGDRVAYVKITGAGQADNGNITIGGNSTVEFNADFSGGNYGGNLTGLYAGPMLHGENAVGEVTGKAEIVINDDKAFTHQVWTAGGLFNKDSTLTVGSVSTILKRGMILSSLHNGGVAWGANDIIDINGDSVIKIENGRMYEKDYNGWCRIFGGVFARGKATQGHVKRNVDIEITGGKNIAYLFAGGEAADENAVSNVSGDTTITISGEGAGAFKSDPAHVIIGAGGVCRSAENNAQALVGGNGTVIFKDITNSPFNGTVTGLGAIWNTGKALDLSGSWQYKSVLGTTTFVLDNVKGEFKGTVASFDVVEVRPGTAVTGLTPEKFDAGKIKLTGNWTNFGMPSVLTFDRAVEVPVNFREATGIVSAEFNDSKTELVVTCKNAPIAVTPTALKLQPGKSDTVKATTYAADETVSWKSSDETVATVDGDGKVTAHKAGIAVISATGSVTKTTAGCTVTVEDPAAPDPVPTPAPVTPTVVTEKDNPVTKDKDVPADVKPATPVIKPATEENTKALAASADVPVKFFTATADGNITVDPVIAKKTVASVMSDDAAVAPKTIVTLPIITATISDGKVAALAMKTTGAQLGAAANNIVSDITLIKILKDETGAKFGYTAEPAGYADQSFTLKNADGNNLAFTDKIDPAATYTLILFVKDNGEFDYDKTTGSVIDPVAMAMNEAKAPKPSGGSSSGCSAGVGVLALLALLPLAAARRRK
ncbi:Ig-like domain-containing protein [Cloacibacillus porcorum]|uniref:Ig-like domain-containing protein n=4 Tax=Cloacibacillus porcorum TaxID=1197717 RepID=UPI001459FAC0|nr:Ig-like domain-containing protein [Cloacibacillus porcorum]